MTRAVVVKVVEFDERLYVGNGIVNRWVRRVTFSFQKNAQLEAPVNKRAVTSHGGAPGALRRGIVADVSHRTPKTLIGRVTSTAPHSLYVLGGTAAQGRRYIYSSFGWANKAQVDLIARRVARGGRAGEGTTGFYMRLPPNAGHGRRVFHLRVHGQRANNFLVSGYNRTARTHRALRPMAPRFVYRA